MKRASFFTVMFIVSVVLIGCAEKAEKPPREGEQVSVAVGDGQDVEYMVVQARRLNRSDAEDKEYLEGRPVEASGHSYLAVFVRIKNTSNSPYKPPNQIELVDSEDKSYEPIQGLANVFALRFNKAIAPGQSAPAPDSPAAAGLAKGAMILYYLPDQFLAKRPVELRIPQTSEQAAAIELDV